MKLAPAARNPALLWAAVKAMPTGGDPLCGAFKRSVRVVVGGVPYVVKCGLPDHKTYSDHPLGEVLDGQDDLMLEIAMQENRLGPPRYYLNAYVAWGLRAGVFYAVQPWLEVETDEVQMEVCEWRTLCKRAGILMNRLDSWHHIPSGRGTDVDIELDDGIILCTNVGITPTNRFRIYDWGWMVPATWTKPRLRDGMIVVDELAAPACNSSTGE